MTDATLTLEDRIVILNTEVFGADDEYSKKPQQLKRCAIFYIEDKQGEIIAYALLRPGRISTLERYGVHPERQGTGLGGDILRAVCQKYPIIWTYVSTINVASAAALTRAGFVPAGGSGEWLSLIHVRSDRYPSKKVRQAVTAKEQAPVEPEGLNELTVSVVS